tara:strand:- start:237 stop:533 length:297 start_codon:yes stop_codon:yes gene_type:complete
MATKTMMTIGGLVVSPLTGDQHSPFAQQRKKPVSANAQAVACQPFLQLTGPQSWLLYSFAHNKTQDLGILLLTYPIPLTLLVISLPADPQVGATSADR